MNSKTRTKALSWLLSIMLMLGLFSGLSLTAYAEPEVHTHNGVTFSPWNSGNSLPTESGNYYLTQDVTISSTWIMEGSTEISLCLNGHGIRFSGNQGPVICLRRGEPTLNLYDCDTATTHYITLTDGRGSAVSDTFTEGAIEVTGGYITGGNIPAPIPDLTRTGGGVYISEFSKVNMYGGTIIGNKAVNGGGVGFETSFVEFNMYGGKITRNTASNNGGGVAFFGSGDTFNMYGGEITDNTAGNNGGGVGICDESSGFLNIYGGTITGNTASGQGGGVYLSGGGGGNNKMSLSGSTTITGNKKGSAANNLYYASGRIDIKGALTNTTPIGVTKAGGTGRFVAGEDVNASHAAHFTSDNPAYFVRGEDFSLWLEEKPPVADTTTVQVADKDAFVDNDGLGNLRLITEVAYATVNNMTAYGTWFIPQSLLNDNNYEHATVNYTGSITSGKTFTADLIKIPAANISTSIAAVSYVVIEGQTVASEVVTANVADLKNETSK